MKIGIIGAGFTGLSAGLWLTKRGHSVTIFEKESMAGGLAMGFADKKWKWRLESHYHHLFTNDVSAFKFAKKVGVKIKVVRPKTSTFINGTTYQLDSPFSLLAFPWLGMASKLRTGMTLAFLKFTPFWRTLEKTTAERFLKKWMGKQSWRVLWEPLFVGKFGKFTPVIPASWFWARIKKRTPSLGYPEGGFARLAEETAKKITKKGGVIELNTEVKRIEKDKTGIRITTNKGEEYQFDKVVCTLPFPVLASITKGLPKNYRKKTTSFGGIGAVNLVIAMKKRLLEDGTYWLNVCEKHFPFLAVVEHTNFMSRKIYSGESIVYVGNYLPAHHEYFNLSSQELFARYLPYLQKINNNFSQKWVRKKWLFKAGFAQPIITTNYSKKLPGFTTPSANLYTANIQQVYPWDRGTNYAIEMGEKVAEFLLED